MSISPVKYLYRFKLNDDILAEVYGAGAASRFLTSLNPQLERAVTLSTYRLQEEVKKGDVAEFLANIQDRRKDQSKVERAEDESI